METVQLVTALDEPACKNVGKTHFGLRDGRKLPVQHAEGDVSFPAAQRGNWDCRMSAIKLEKHRGVYWLPGMVTETLNGVPLSSNPETASAVVEETVISATDPDITTQLELSEKTTNTRHHHATWTGTGTMHVKMHTCRSNHGVERQWNMHTDLRQARTEVRPRWEGIISSW